MNLLPQVDRYFKANLHTHTDCSDGNHSPEEVKALYKERGYQILAITDHEICLRHEALNDPDFLTLTAYELATTEASFDISPWRELCRPQDSCFLRLTVTDGRGRTAYTRAYFADEL